MRNIKLIPVSLDCQTVIDYVNTYEKWEASPYEGHKMQQEARVMDMTINNPCWSKIQAPWKKAADAEPVRVAAGG